MNQRATDIISPTGAGCLTDYTPSGKENFRHSRRGAYGDLRLSGFLVRFLCFAALLATSPAFSQTIRGSVFSAQDGKPLAGAIVRMTDKTGRTGVYRFTDRNGEFNLIIPDGQDTLKVSLLGYREQAFLRPFQDHYQIRLEAVEERIREAVVTAQKVMEAGDTIRYNVNALKRREDVVLGDLLKRIPGIELDDRGYVKYNGLAVNRFYIEGKDILENNYNLATRNLSVDAVQEVDVLENHQPYKLLRGVRTSDRAALNIRLREEARSRINGGIEAGVGGSDGSPAVTASARLSAFYVGQDFSSVDVGGFDNQGNALREADLSMEQGRSYLSQPLQERILMQAQQAPLEEKRALFNETWEASTVNRVSFGENVSMSVTARYGRDCRKSGVWNQSVYQTSEVENRILDRSENGKTRSERFSGALSFQNNGSKLYVSDRMYVDCSRKGGVLSVTGDMDRLQRMDGGGWHIENEASLFARIGERIFNVESFSQFSGLEEGLDLDSGTICQGRKVRMIYQRLVFSGISRQRGWWRFSFSPEVDFSLFHSTSILAPFPQDVIPGTMDGRENRSLFRPSMRGRLQYRKSPWEVSMDGVIRYPLYFGNGESQGLVTGDISGRLKYVSGRWEASLGGGVNQSAPDVQTLGGSLILTGYYTLWRGRERLRTVPQWNMMADYRYRAPVSGWNFRFKGTFTKGKSFVSARDLFGEYVLGYLTDETSGFMTLNSGLELSRGLFQWNGKWKLALDYIWSQTGFVQAGQTIPNQVHALSPVGGLSLSLARWWGMTLECGASFSSYRAVGFETLEDRTLTVKTKQAFHFSTAWTGGIGVDLYHFADLGKTMAFPDLSITWTGIKGLRLRLAVDNLLNIQSYSFVTVSPLLKETYSFRIRPITVLLGADWRF